jgi:hypothetical protein
VNPAKSPKRTVELGKKLAMGQLKKGDVVVGWYFTTPNALAAVVLGRLGRVVEGIMEKDVITL